MPITEPKDVKSYHDAKATWESFVPPIQYQNVQFTNQFFALQTTRSSSALKNTPAKQKYRILMVDTSSVLKKSKYPAVVGGNGSKLIGKNLVIAEAYDEEDILIDWEKLERYLYGMLLVVQQQSSSVFNNRKIQWDEFCDTLESIGQKRIKSAPTSAPSSPTVMQTALEKTVSSPALMSAPPVQEEKVDKGIVTSEEAFECLENLLTLVNSVRSVLKRLNNGTTNLKLQNQLEKDFAQAVELDKRLATYLDSKMSFSTKRSSKALGDIDIVAIGRLQSQHQDISNILKELKDDTRIKKIVQESRRQKCKSMDVYEEKAIKRLQQRSIDFDNDGAYFDYEDTEQEYQEWKKNQFQMKTQEVKLPVAQISMAKMSEVEVERKIAEETKKSLQAVETDYNDLHAMHQDLHDLVAEQGIGINVIIKNVDDAGFAIYEGNNNIRKSRRYLFN
jgi:hypothetical protein